MNWDRRDTIVVENTVIPRVRLRLLIRKKITILSFTRKIVMVTMLRNGRRSRPWSLLL
ncbi:hypothetical protein HanHA300_Chr07g0230231 [Helianthus annuus]|nr:hypothetical protein HanHA300_Chr07g0230231 [Helianthus annuus]KAJ0730271.1 hypothetical protein HanOQP8_Chr07g0238091 [Helianthus annuus]